MQTRMGRFKQAWVFLLMIVVLVSACQGDDLVVSSYQGNGFITWTYPTNGIHQYRIEWASDLTSDQWGDLGDGCLSVPVTGEVMHAKLPMFYRIKAQTEPPSNMVYIPGGVFPMGDMLMEGGSDERPVHPVALNGFYMDRYEVSSNLWKTVYDWAVLNGYDFENLGGAKDTNHPILTVNWYDAVKWCNARSEFESLHPCYYTSDSFFASVYKSGRIDLSNSFVNWNTTGYRLPTEAEWERASRGPAVGQRFSWAVPTIQHDLANYTASSLYGYDVEPLKMAHPAYNILSWPYTCPVSDLAPNGYGVYHMADNVAEWCWDAYDASYYGSSVYANPRGTAYSSLRVVRGGVFSAQAYECRNSFRNAMVPGNAPFVYGFRCARSR